MTLMVRHFYSSLILALLSTIISKIRHCGAFLVFHRSHVTSTNYDLSNRKTIRENKNVVDVSCLSAVREATFGMGCFWEPSESLLKVEGVLDTVVGYAGGSMGGGNSKPSIAPTYDDVCYGDAWVESVRVAYDDSILTYEHLLDCFLEFQKPVIGDRQYASVIFPSNDIENEQAQQGLTNVALAEQSVIGIEYSPSESSDNDSDVGVLFYRAEEYHQEYWQKNRPRIVMGAILLSLASGLFTSILPVEIDSQLKLGSMSLFAVGAIYYGFIERAIDESVRELPSGSFAISAAARLKEKET